MLTPAIVTDLCLFSYPVPLDITEIDSTTDFLLTLCKLWTPLPNEVNTTVLIPDKTSLTVLNNLTVSLSSTETWYFASVVNPPIPSCPFVLYITCSVFLNLWYVPNPIVDTVAPSPTLFDAASEKNETEWSINFIFGCAAAPVPLPPVIVILGFSA